jgi:hypothetical protein
MHLLVIGYSTEYVLLYNRILGIFCKDLKVLDHEDRI